MIFLWWCWEFFSKSTEAWDFGNVSKEFLKLIKWNILISELILIFLKKAIDIWIYKVNLNKDGWFLETDCGHVLGADRKAQDDIKTPLKASFQVHLRHCDWDFKEDEFRQR